MPHEIIMPQLGMAQDTGIIVAWRKQVGDPVAAADILMEVETDKTTMEVEAGCDGFIAEIRASENTPVPVGDVVAVVAASAAEAAVVKTPPPAASNKQSVSAPPRGQFASPAADSPQPAEQTPAHVLAPAGRVFASPKARGAAKERNINLTELADQGIEQPIHYADLNRYAPSSHSAAPYTTSSAMPAASPYVRQLARRYGLDLAAVAARMGMDQVSEANIMATVRGDGGPRSEASGTGAYWRVDHAAFGDIETEPLSRRDLLAADNLQAAAQTIPAVTHHEHAVMDKCGALQKSFSDEAAKRGVRLTALAFHVKALAGCLREFPRFNASLSPDSRTLILKKYIHIGVAVDTSSGLIVPVIRDADSKDIWGVAADIADLAARAKERTLRSADTGGGSMTISNLGSIGGDGFTPIINPPEAAILGISRSRIQPVWDGGKFQPVPLCPLSLTYDHRVINGADAARFMRRYTELLSEPHLL